VDSVVGAKEKADLAKVETKDAVAKEETAVL
jgi:hypothetical protein